jgi:phosphoglycolate phosphatase
MFHDVELYIFDWSGTISDDRHPVYLANQRMSDHWGIARITFDQWLPKTAMTVVEYFRDAGVEATDEEIFALYERTYNDIMHEHALPHAYADAKPVLTSIKSKNKPMTVVSAHPTENLIREAVRYELREFFDEMVGSAREKSSHIRDLMKTYDADPSRTLYIGDTIQDIRHAKAAGVLMAAMTTGYHTPEVLAVENPDAIFDSLTELSNALSSSR